MRIPLSSSKATWNEWAAGEGQELVSMGIPQQVVNSPYIWEDFVTHGLVETHGDLVSFEYEQIDSKHYPRLLEILLNSYPPSDHPLYDLILVLWRMVKPNEAFWDHDKED